MQTEPLSKKDYQIIEREFERINQNMIRLIQKSVELETKIKILQEEIETKSKIEKIQNKFRKLFSK